MLIGFVYFTEMLLLWLFAALNLVQLSFANHCPKEPNEHCSCRDFGQYYINVDCKSISNVEETLKSLGDIAKSPLELKITDYPLKRIPSHFLDGISVGSLMIRNTKLEEIDDEAFTSLRNSIFSLEIMNTSLKSLSASSMKNFSTLEVLIISEDGNLQNSITADDTKDLPSSIDSLDITHTSLKIIGNNAFSNMKMLRYLSLRGNKLTSLPDNAFPMKLEILDLSHNDFLTLPVKPLSSFLSGTQIYLNGNHISKFPKGGLDVLMSKKYHLELQKNNIECECEMKWLPDFLKQNPSSAHRTKFGDCKGYNSRLNKMIVKLVNVDFGDC
ncbi:Insulin-like growth factor-binding protein complex acid labile subunit [Nymphon striatum]|nr:Insulin-like growth factor-binding protein complex acid labile subunit [Nymphon striatum]